MLRFKPIDASLSEGLRLSGLTLGGKAAGRPVPSFLKSKGCMFWRRLSGDELFRGLVLMLRGGEFDETGPLVVGIFKKFSECFW